MLRLLVPESRFDRVRVLNHGVNVLGTSQSVAPQVLFSVVSNGQDPAQTQRARSSFFYSRISCGGSFARPPEKRCLFLATFVFVDLVADLLFEPAVKF